MIVQDTKKTKIKKVPLILFLATILSIVIGLTTSFAGKSDTISVNGVDVNLNDEFTMKLTIEEYDALISACAGNIDYDSAVLELKAIENVQEGFIYNGGSGSVKFAAANATEGMKFTEGEAVMEFKFQVISSDIGSTSVNVNIEELYSLDEENKQDVAIESTSSIEVAGGTNAIDGGQDEIVKTGDMVLSKSMIFYGLAVVLGFVGIVMNLKPKYKV